MNIFKSLILQKNFCLKSLVIFHLNRNSSARIYSTHHILGSDFSQCFLTTQKCLSLNSARFFTDYKSPVNAGKNFKPQQIPISKQNQHLLVQVFGQNNEDLGVLSLGKAKEKANSSNLKLVMIDETPSPPHAKFLTGKELYELQIKAKREKQESDSTKISKEKEVDMNLGIEEHDLETKMKMIKNFVEKGHPTTIKIDSKIHNKKVKKKYLFKD